MFEKTLTDLVKGIRASKRGTTTYISQCIAEIKTELNSSDMFVKSNALQKLTFLQMMGFTMNWDRASFATIEVMSSPRFAHKRVGCLAASQGFTQDTEVILLTTNLLKKELRGAVGGGMHGVYEAGLAINCISNIVTEDLARDLLADLTNLTSHPQPYLRKKAILCMFKLFVKYPQGLRLTFARLQQCLDDSNSSVVSCAVNVITELSDKNPKNYLHLAPAFFQLLTQSNNNWMLIKVVKLLGSLVTEEPRLARKLLVPLSAIVQNTQAKSLLYESVRTITLCLPYCAKSDGSMPANVPEIVDVCANTLLDFVTQSDQNLKYLGLVGFGSLMQSHPQVLSDPKYRPLILTCLSDQDVTIRSRALDLLTVLASRKNIVELVSQLLKHVEPASGTYKNDLVAKIVEMCSGDKYSRLPDFKWYLDVIFQLGHVRGIEKHGDLLRAQVTDVALRVAPIRPYAVRRSMEILLEEDGETSDDPFGDNGRGKHLMSQLLPAIAWIIGEYSDQIQNALTIDPEDDEVGFSFDENSKGTYHALLQCLTSPMNTLKLPTGTQKVYVQAAIKVFAAASNDTSVTASELESCVAALHYNFPVYTQSTDVEVVERSFTLLELLKSFGLSSDVLPPSGNISELMDKVNVGDLLGIDGAGDIAVDVEGKSTPSSMVSVVRESSATLAYLLKSSPMKPTPSKAQKKKRQAPIGVSVDVDAPVNLRIFQALIAQEGAYRAEIRSSVEAVSFTQQTPFKAEDPKSMISLSVLGKAMFQSQTPGHTNEFQKPSTEAAEKNVSRSRQGDPFYLEPARSDDQFDERSQSRFGAIQLLSNSDDERNVDPKKKKKLKKKANKGIQIEREIAFWPSNEIAAFASDDDNEESGNVVSRQKDRSKDFAGLAKVDLTTPLRDDEVIPERTHRVVPTRTAPKEESKKRRKDKKSKHKTTLKDSANATFVGDLLDLDVSVPFNDGERKSFSTSHPISSAFDDLLSMPMPNSLIPNTNNLSNTTNYSDFVNDTQFSEPNKQPWLAATLSPQAGSTGFVNWSELTVMFQTSRLFESNKVGALVVVRIDNRSQTAFNGLNLKLSGAGSARFDSIAPKTCSAVSATLGPFFYDISKVPMELNGVLDAGNEIVSVKICLPASALLDPEKNVSLEYLAQELAQSNWTSSSAKVDFLPSTNPENIKKILGEFLRAELITGSALNSTVGTYAARSTTGDPVRVLIKVKDRYAKVDVKSTNRKLSKALANDIKRIVLTLE